MLNIKYVTEVLEKSKFGIFSNKGFIGQNGDLEVDRIISNKKGGQVLSLRVRNTSDRPLKIYSFDVADFVIPKKVNIRSILEHGWLQCSEVAIRPFFSKTEKNKIFLQRDQNPFSFDEKYGYIKDSLISEWFTHFEINRETFFIGAVTTADQFAQIFLKETENGFRVRVTSQFDGLIVEPGQVAKSEQIFFGIGSGGEVKKYSQKFWQIT